ncbi:Cas4 family exonuclease [Streptomyces phage Bilo]|nr:Cas4 family exonuclease [Streptomyces phage Bilo]
MDWNKHSQLAGTHAFLSASKYHWNNWTLDKLDRAFTTHQAAQRGTALHALAHMAIGLRQYMGGPEQEHNTLSLYVRDAIDLGMVSEQMLFVSRNCFGTADTIGFKKRKLNIHDLKTGVNPTSYHQLENYAAFFCLEYGVDPFDIEIELRIYQNDEIRVYDADPAAIRAIMETIIEFDQYIEKRRAEEE